MSYTQHALQEVFRTVLNEPDLVIELEDSPHTVAEWDSLTHIALVVSVEAKFGIEFDASDIEGIATVSDFIAAIDASVSA